MGACGDGEVLEIILHLYATSLDVQEETTHFEKAHDIMYGRNQLLAILDRSIPNFTIFSISAFL